MSGQFSQRFLYLYPECLSGVSIGAAGLVTALGGEEDWPQGTGDVEDLFGRKCVKKLVGKVPIQLVFGGDDTEVNGGEFRE
ncbi:hypothetical protein IMZ48_11890 [Candidatus Bathyarchaeota archaeon]|nr:hypothetical protein [Candidatus Bathyarchaeota archaeon]